METQGTAPVEPQGNGKQIELRVAEALQDDVDKGIVRIDVSFLKELGINIDFFVLWEKQRKGFSKQCARGLEKQRRMFETYLEFILGASEEAIQDFFSPDHTLERNSHKEIWKRMHEDLPIKNDRPTFWKKVAETTPRVYSQYDLEFLSTAPAQPEYHMLMATGSHWSLSPLPYDK